MRKFRIPYIPYRSLLLSTTVLNDNHEYHCFHYCDSIIVTITQLAYYIILFKITQIHRPLVISKLIHTTIIISDYRNTDLFIFFTVACLPDAARDVTEHSTEQRQRKQKLRAA